MTWQRFPTGSALSLQGVFDASQVDFVLKEANAVLQQALEVLAVDGSQLGFVDSSALGCLVMMAQKCRRSGCRFILVNFPPPIREIITMTKLDKLLPHYPGTLAEFVRSLPASGSDPAS
ncbi:MAG: STAS domain-containing protein, partial [Deltaproteobacteria bacterium]|nr:STAS domain-containing protein [Deltaproteobacteria bacterium]